MKILWLAPNFNHYKARFLDHLAREGEIELTILAGRGRTDAGDRELDRAWSFELIRCDVPKSKFGNSKMVQEILKREISKYDWVLIPAEKKNFKLLINAVKLRKKSDNVKLFSYNHPVFKSKQQWKAVFDKLLTKQFYKQLDRVIFYTEESYNQALKQDLAEPFKLRWANNTIDTLEINKNYDFSFPPEKPITLVFIGRLIPSKRIDDAFHYYRSLKDSIKHLTIRLEVIGDGPDASKLKELKEGDHDVVWHGTLVEEDKIAPIMKRSTIVFIPGLSGLSINHAFAYGRPYVTLDAKFHGPEIAYLEDGYNGMLLKQSFTENIERLSMLISDRKTLNAYCSNAKTTGEKLSINNWVTQMKNSLAHE